MELNLKIIDLTFDKFTHTYTLNGKVVPSVSSISGLLPKDWMANWISKELINSVRALWNPFKAYTQEEIDKILDFSRFAHRKSSGRATTAGTSVHSWLEQYIKSGVKPPIPADPEIANCINKFLEWEEQNGVIWVASEIFCASESLQYAGQIDALAIVNGELCLIDFKTSKSIYSEYYLQTAGYQMALEEMGCPKIAHRYILRLPKVGGNIDFKKVPSDYEHDKKCFRGLLFLHHWIKQYDKRS